MDRIIALYRLKEGVTMEEYRKYSLEIDQPITSVQPGVRRFEVYAVTASGEGPLNFDIMENIEVDSWEAWQEVTKSEPMKKVVTNWPRYCDESSVLLIRGDKIQ